MREELHELTRPSQGEIQVDLEGLFRGAVRMVLELVLEEEVRRIVGAGRYARIGRRDHRNGSYLRQLVTSVGRIDVKMPRTRNHGAPVDVIGRYRRRTEAIDDAVVAAYVNGVSTRGMGEVTEALMGDRVDRSTVSRITQRLDDEVKALATAPIEGEVPYLYLDATVLNARWARKVENVSALVAYGVGEDGHRRLLAIAIGPQESEETWSSLLRQLLERGLTGVRLVIADDHRGLTLAVRTHLPEAEAQRCTVHFQRNILSTVPRRLRRRVAREVADLFRRDSLKDAKKTLARFKTRWQKQLPEAVACLQSGFAAATRFYRFPKEHWTRIRSTNGLERLHGEIKRRVRAVGAFPDRASALRLVVAVALKVTTVWQDRRYLDMSLLDVQLAKEKKAA